MFVCLFVCFFDSTNKSGFKTAGQKIANEKGNFNNKKVSSKKTKPERNKERKRSE